MAQARSLYHPNYIFSARRILIEIPIVDQQRITFMQRLLLIICRLLSKGVVAAALSVRGPMFIVELLFDCRSPSRKSLRSYLPSTYTSNKHILMMIASIDRFAINTQVID
jgi:hypothetical protein